MRIKNLNPHLILLFLALVLTACSQDDPGVQEPLEEPQGNEDPLEEGFQGIIDQIRNFGGSLEDTGTGVVRATDGNYVVLGTTRSSDGDITDKVGNDADYWLLKVNQQGTLLWSRTYGGSADDIATGISSTGDGGFILSGYSRSADGDVGGNEGFHDYWIVKTDAMGNLQWEQNFGFSGSDQAFKVIQTRDGGYFATGFLDVTASNGQGNDTRNPEHGVGEYWGIKMDAEGKWQWRRYFGGTNNDRSYDVRQTSDNGFLLIGASESEDFDITDSKGSYDYWVVKIGANGNKQWTRSYGGSEIDVAYAMTPTTDGNYILVGDSRSIDQDVSSPKGNADVWVVKFDTTGRLLWERSYGGSLFESARGISPMGNGKYLITASSRSSGGDLTENKGENDAWFFMIDNDGTLLLQKSIGGSALDFGEAIVEGNDDRVVLIGSSESDNGDLPGNKGATDLLFVQFK